jgi:hypothetical protein
LKPIATEPISVILLAHDAEAHLEHVVNAWLTYLHGLNRDFELLLVDDASNDRTAAQAAELAAKSQRVHYLRNPGPPGDGTALRVATAAARFPLLFYTRCDPLYRSAYLNRLLVEPQARDDDRPAAPLIDAVHLTTGFQPGPPAPWPVRGLAALGRLLCWLLFNAAPAPAPGWLGWRRGLAWLFTRMVFGVRNRDVTCPVRLLRREILAQMPLQSDGPFVHAEILAKAAFRTLLVSEDVPLGDRQRPAPPAPALRWRSFFRDAWRVFRRPDFGPPPASP